MTMKKCARGETHLMGSVLYNDLIRRGLDVDGGVIEYNAEGKSGRSYEVRAALCFKKNLSLNIMYSAGLTF